MSNRGNPRGGAPTRGRGEFRGGGPPRGGPPGGGGRGGGPGRGDFGRGGARGGFGGGGRGRGGPPQIYAADVPPRIDPRLLAADGAVASFKTVPFDPAHPLRPGFGTLGQPVVLRANFFPITFLQTPIYEYKAVITPTTDIQRLKTRIFQLLEASPEFRPHVAYTAHDRSERIVAAKKLPQPLSAAITFFEEGQAGPEPNARVYTLNITHVGEDDPTGLTK